MAVQGAGRAARLGDGRRGRAWVFDGANARTPAKVQPMRRGFNNLPEVLSVRGATWAHRGGSASYAEGSSHAYTQSVARGYGVLEVSFSRTADGVWFALHDRYLDRVVGFPAGTNADPQLETWDELRWNYSILPGPDGVSGQFVSAGEIFAAYGDSHVIVVDPKHQGNHLDEFFQMVAEQLGTERAVFKFSGDATWLAAMAKARGFTTWGYFYEADFTAGRLASQQSAWDWLGMEWGASSAAWAAVKSYGKPVVGHICATQAQYDTAVAKGADMVQCSGVAAIRPVSWWT